MTPQSPQVPGEAVVCHCGKPVVYGYDGDPTHHRGMCALCDSVRCDAFPGQCCEGERPMSECVFCRIVAGDAPAEMVCEWDDAVAFRPLAPVTNGHTLVIPRAHVDNYATDPDVTAATMRRAAQLAPVIHRQSNLITSAGEWATQTVFHLHVHIVPRRPNDGLHLPWDGAARVAEALAPVAALADKWENWGARTGGMYVSEHLRRALAADRTEGESSG